MSGPIENSKKNGENKKSKGLSLKAIGWLTLLGVVVGGAALAFLLINPLGLAAGLILGLQIALAVVVGFPTLVGASRFFYGLYRRMMARQFRSETLSKRDAFSVKGPQGPPSMIDSRVFKGNPEQLVSTIKKSETLSKRDAFSVKEPQGLQARAELRIKQYYDRHPEVNRSSMVDSRALKGNPEQLVSMIKKEETKDVTVDCLIDYCKLRQAKGDSSFSINYQAMGKMLELNKAYIKIERQSGSSRVKFIVSNEVVNSDGVAEKLKKLLEDIAKKYPEVSNWLNLKGYDKEQNDKRPLWLAYVSEKTSGTVIANRKIVSSEISEAIQAEKEALGKDRGPALD